MNILEINKLKLCNNELAIYIKNKYKYDKYCTYINCEGIFVRIENLYITYIRYTIGELSYKVWNPNLTGYYTEIYNCKNYKSTLNIKGEFYPKSFGIEDLKNAMNKLLNLSVYS